MISLSILVSMGLGWFRHPKHHFLTIHKDHTTSSNEKKGPQCYASKPRVENAVACRLHGAKLCKHGANARWRERPREPGLFSGPVRCVI